MARRFVLAFVIFALVGVVPAELWAQAAPRATVRITNAESAPYTKGLLTAWLVAAGYTVVDMPARYECRLDDIQEQDRGGGGYLQTPWGTIQNRSAGIGVRVLFTLYDESRQTIFTSAVFRTGNAQTSFNAGADTRGYATNVWGYGETLSDAILHFFRQLPPAPAPRLAEAPASTTATATGSTILWVDLTQSGRRAVISGLPGTQFWTRFFSIKLDGQRGELTSTALRTLPDEGWYVLRNASDPPAPRIVDIILDGETTPIKTIILQPGGPAQPGEVP